MTPLKGSSGGFVKVARDLTEKQQAEEELRQAREELELRVAERTKELDKSNKALKQEVLERTRSEHERVALLRRIVTTQEDERGRIARDLHDQLGQRLTALRLKIASLKDACALDKELHARVRHIEQTGPSMISGSSPRLKALSGNGRTILTYPRSSTREEWPGNASSRR
jgi:signal transduction histidine kinase